MQRRLHSSPRLLITLAAFSLAMAVPTQAQNVSLSVMVDNKTVNFGGVLPIQSGGRLLVPLRGVFEALGATVEFSQATNTIRAIHGETQLQITIGSTQAFINGGTHILDVPPQVVDGRTLVPLRFVAEGLGAQVSFDQTTGIASVTSPPGVGNPTYGVPGGQTVSGTLLRVDTTPPNNVTVSVGGELKTFRVAPTVLVLRRISLATSTSQTPVRQTARQIYLNMLSSGDPVRLVLDESGQATQIMSTATAVLAKVQFAAGNQIVLDDAHDTTLTIGPNLRYVDPKGKAATTVSLPAGQNVGLFISRDSHTIYLVSAYAPDFAGSGEGTPDPVEEGTSLPPVGAPKILLVQHDAAAPLKAGAELHVTVRGTAGLRGFFNVGPRINRQPLAEDPARPGVYTGTYNVKAGDDVLGARVTGILQGVGGIQDTAQSDDALTIDTIPPRLLGTFPQNAAQINVAQPNIAIFTDDLGGSGLGAATMQLVTGPGDGIVTNVPTTVAPPTSVNAVAPKPLSGQVDVRAVITDKAGNALHVDFGFFVVTGGANNLISSFAHGANRAMLPGEDVPLAMTALPAGKASYDVLTGRGEIVAKNLPLTETSTMGRYRGTYRIPTNPGAQLRFLGHFTATDDSSAQVETTTRVTVVASPTAVSIASPDDEERVTSPVVVRGQAAPGSLVNVSLRAEYTQFYIWSYKEELGTTQIKADLTGAWQTKPLDLPTRKNADDMHYTITAVALDATNKPGDPVLVTVRTK